MRVSCELSDEQKSTQLADLRAYWDEHVPNEIPFDPDKAMTLLLHNARIFEWALYELGKHEESGLPSLKLHTRIGGFLSGWKKALLVTILLLVIFAIDLYDSPQNEIYKHLL